MLYSQLGLLFPGYEKINNVPNHQPVWESALNMILCNQTEGSLIRGTVRDHHPIMQLKGCFQSPEKHDPPANSHGVWSNNPFMVDLPVKNHLVPIVSIVLYCQKVKKNQDPPRVLLKPWITTLQSTRSSLSSKTQYIPV